MPDAEPVPTAPGAPAPPPGGPSAPAHEAGPARPEAREAYRGLFDHLTELVYVQGLDGRFLDVNEAVLRAYGYAREELIGQLPEVLGAPGLVDVDDVMRRFARAVEGEPQRFDWWGRRKDGSVFPKEVTIKRWTYLGRDVVLAVARDISERMEAEAALRRSEEHFRRLIEHASDLISILDAEGVVRYESPSITRLLGYTPEELLGRSAFAYIAEEDAGRVAERFREAVENPGTSVGVEFRFRHKDGSWRTIEAVGTTLDAASAAEGVVVNSRDVTERRRAEEALRESEALKRAVVASALDAVISIDGAGRVIEFNPAAERTFGHAAAEVLGRPMAEIIVPPRLRAAHAGGMDRYRRTGEAHVLGQRIEVPALRADGSEFPAELAIEVVRLEGGREVFTAYLRDISARKEAEAALRRSEEHFRLLIENSSDVATILDADGVNRYQSPAITRVFGYRPEEMAGQSAFERIHPDDAAKAREVLGGVLREPGVPRVVEFRYRHKDGTWRVVESTARTLLPDSAAAGVIVNTHDVTERVEAARSLRLQKTMLEAQGEASLDGVVVIAPDGRILSHNSRFVEMWGLPPEVVGAEDVRPVRAALAAQVRDPEAFLARVAALYADPDEEAREELALRDGRVLDRYTAPVRSREGEYYGRIWFFRDITAQKRHAEELEQARHEAERAREQASRYAASLEASLHELRAAQHRLVQQEKMASLGRLTAGIAHELKNPLNFVNNFSLISAGLVDDLRAALAAGDGAHAEELLADLQQNARKVHEHGRRADAIVRGMMEHAPAGPDDAAQPRRPVDLNALVDLHLAHAVEARRADAPPLVVHRDFGADVGAVPAVPQELGRVVHALLANALDAVDERAAREPGPFAPTISVRTWRDGGTVTVEVGDNGAGVPEDARARVFEPFFTSKPAGSGHTGLGLSLAHETVVEGYGGWMDLQSAEGEGTTFSFCLPAV